ncbi:MAG TPA: hypothetical protein VF377_08840 [Acidimicrobiia bacterium]
MHRKLWILWTIGGLGSLAAILVAGELGHPVSARTWALWALLGLGSFAVLEIHGLARPGEDDTFSELVWSLGTARSIVLFACAWGIFALATGNVWPSFGAFALAWCLWHFWKEGPYGEKRED